MSEVACSFRFPDEHDGVARRRAACGWQRAGAVEMAERLDNTELLSLALRRRAHHVRGARRREGDGHRRRAASAARRRGARDRRPRRHLLHGRPGLLEQGRYEDARLVSEEGVSRVTALGGHADGLVGDSGHLPVPARRLGRRAGGGTADPRAVRRQPAWVPAHRVGGDRVRAVQPRPVRRGAPLRGSADGDADAARVPARWGWLRKDGWTRPGSSSLGAADHRCRVRAAGEGQAAADGRRAGTSSPSCAPSSASGRSGSTGGSGRRWPTAGEAAIALAHGDAARAAELPPAAATDGYSAAGAEWEAAVSRARARRGRWSRRV